LIFDDFPSGILLLVSMILSSAVTFLQGYQGRILVAIGPTIQWMLKYLLPFFLTYCMFVLIYKIILIRDPLFIRPSGRPVYEPALGTGQASFRWYVVHLARYSIFYGSLSTLVIFIFWVYYSSTILVLEGSLLISWKKADKDRQGVWCE